jgi:hypothetical protein
MPKSGASVGAAGVATVVFVVGAWGVGVAAGAGA